MNVGLLRLLLLLQITFCVSLLHAQQEVVLKGTVSSEEGAPLGNTVVKVAELSLGTYSDSLGKFEISIPKGTYEISVSHLGFETQQLRLSLSRDTFIEVVLKTTVMAEVAISGTRNPRTAKQDESGIITLQKESFSLLPAFLGENDPIRSVQMQPGIQSGNEGSRGIFVRGGSPDQNLMLMDGVPVYNPSHIYGFISVFNGDAIERIDVYKDKYPARFGGRLGSVMDIKVDEGNREKLKGSVTIGLVTSRLYLDGPLTKKKKTTLSFSGRACYAGLYTSPISKKQFESSGYDGDVSYYFGDLNVKLAHHFNDKNTLEINLFTNRDYYSFEKITGSEYFGYRDEGTYGNDVNWSNETASIAWINELNSKWSFANRIGFSRYHLNSVFTDNYISFYELTGDTNYYSNISTDSKSFIYNIGWSGDAAYTTVKHKVRFGAGVNEVVYETGKGSTSVRNINGDNYVIADSNKIVKPEEGYLYIEDEYRPFKRFTVGYGLHGRIYFPGKKTYFNLLPRVNVVYNPAAQFYIRASASGLSQNLHLLTASNEDILNDYWVPATAKAPPETAWNFSAGIIQRLPRHFEWSIDGFYRILDNLIEYKYDDDFSITGIPWEKNVVTGGQGKAYGTEFYVGRTGGKITGSAAYTLSWSNRKFDELNRGEYFPYKYDRRHNIALQMNWFINKHFEVGAAWVYGTGNAYTLRTQAYHTWNAATWYDIQVSNGVSYPYGETIDAYSGRNNARTPDFHHLDLSFTYRKSNRNIEHAFSVSVYNVYNRFNVFSTYRDFETDENGFGKVVYHQLSLFPILPSITYTINLRNEAH